MCQLHSNIKKKSEVQENQTNKYSLKTYKVKTNKTTEENV